MTPVRAWALALPIALIPLTPLLTTLASFLSPAPEIWSHLQQHVLSGLLWNTLWLLLGVGVGVAVLGVSLAWLTSACDFPGRRFFSWALLLPLALPTYVMAFVWLGLLDFSGVLPTLLREHFGIIAAPPIRSRGGVIVVMTLALYPYVYLVACSAFHGQGARLLEAAQSLGLSRRRAFVRVALPMARPAIAAGVALALMETLADFGAVAAFNYDTFTTAIYKAWYSLFSLPAAAQLSSLLVCFAFVAILFESHMRNRSIGVASTRLATPARRVVLSRRHGRLAATWAGFVFTLAFVMPLTLMLTWAFEARADIDLRLLDFAVNSFSFASAGAAMLIVLALALSFARRSDTGVAMRALTRFASCGYAVPGAVLAVGFFIPVAWLDNRLIDWFDLDQRILGGSIVVLLLACSARYLAVALGPVEAGLQRISRRMDEAAQSLGVSGGERLRRVHLPLLRGPLLTAAALCFVDIMKELPITLMTRPFGRDTLAVRVFEMTSEGEWERAALPAVAILVVGLAPIILLVRSSENARN